MPTRDFLSTLSHRIGRDTLLTAESQAAVDAIPVYLATVPAGQAIVQRGDKPTRSFMIVEGIACTSLTMENGGRQISSFHLREDLPDLLSLHLNTMDADITAVTDCQVGFMSHSDLRALCHAHPQVSDVLWKVTLVDAAIYRHWVANVGSRPADKRLAHLLLEFMTRMEFLGSAKGECEFPLTQAVLSEATGMSTVHLNRSLKALREAGFIEIDKRRLRIPDRAGLEDFADFSKDYLHLPTKRPGSGNIAPD